MSKDISGPEDWSEFSQETSMHGVKTIGNSDASKVRRAAWLLFTLVGIGYFCYAGGSFLHDCAHKLVSTKIRVEQTDTIKFPTLTVCNQNMFTLTYVEARQAAMGSDALSEILLDLFDPLSELPPPPEKYKADDPKYAYFHNMSPQDTSELMNNGAHPLRLSLVDCRIFGSHFACEDVFEVVLTDAGYCYQFNGNGSLNATSAGKRGGLQLLLNTAVTEYTTGPDSESEGFTFTFHEAHEVPLVRELGIGVQPGVQASIKLHKSQTSRYPPWADGGRSNCFDTVTLPNPLLVYKNYSRSACQVECEAAYVIQKCQCRDPRQPALNSSEPCSLIDMLYCSQPAIETFPGDPKGLVSCDCKDPCIDSEYSAKVSTYKFPSANYVRQRNQSAEQYLYVKNNMMIVNIFYGKLYYTSLTEELAYGFIEAMSNVGGTLGLCVGASLLTVMEYLEFGIRSFIRYIKRIQNRNSGSAIKVTPTSHHRKQ